MNHQKPSFYLLIVLHLIVLIAAIVLLNRRFAFFKPVNSASVSTEVPETLEIHSIQNSAETEIETGTDAEAKADVGTDAGAKADVGTDAGAKADVGTDAGAKADVGTDAEAKADVTAAVGVDTDTATTPFISKCRINLHIRTAPALSGKIIGRIPPRGTGRIMERTNEEWVKVEYNNIVGYSFSRYLEFDAFFGTENSPPKETLVSETLVSETEVSESEFETEASETPSSAMPDAGQEITNKDIIIIRSACYIRNSAGDKNKRNIILTAQSGDEFLHLAAYDQPAWYAIAVEGQSIAYVSRKYAEIETRKTEE